MESPDPPQSTDEETPPTQTPEDLPSRLQSLVRSLQASPRALRRAFDARIRGGESPSSTASPGSPSLGRRLISRLLPAATPSSLASSGGGEESCGGPCSTSSSSAPPSSGPNNTPHPKPGDPATPPSVLHTMPVPEIVLQAPPEGGGQCGEEEGDAGSGVEECTAPLRPSALESTKLLTLVVCGGGSGGSSTVMDGGGSEASVVVGGILSGGGGGGADGGEGGGGIAVVPARKSPVTVQEWVDSLPHSGATTPVPHEASLPGALLCRSEEEEREERAGLAGEGASAAPADMVEDGLSLGAEAGHLYTGCIPDEVMCPHQHSSGTSPPSAPASQTSRRERPGGGASSATAKRREAFAGRREAEGATEGGGGSFQSDSHSPASHSSIDSLLESRRPDPEEMLFGLGFGGAMGTSPHSGQGGPGSVAGSQRGVATPFPFSGCGGDGGSDDEVSRIPRRFLQPSKVKGVAINDFFKYQQDLIETFESGFCGYRGLTGLVQSLASVQRRGESRIPMMNMLWSFMNSRGGTSIPIRFLPSLMGPSHTVPSVIVAKIMEKLREHERESSSRSSVASFGTGGPVCQSPTPPPTPPFSPTSHFVGSTLMDDRLNFLYQSPHPNSPIVSPVESQPTTKFSKVARNVMHRSSILTRMSSGGGDSVVSSEDSPGIACSPTSRALLSVLTPDNRKFLDSQGSKSPETPRKRMIIGQKSFTFGNDGDLIEDLGPPEISTSPTLPKKPPLEHKDSIISSIASLTSCDSDSDTDSAPNIRRSNSARSSGGASHRPATRARTLSGGAESAPQGPWPLGKRLSSTSLSSWEELGGDSPAHGPSSFALLGQRPRFLSIDEGDDETMDNESMDGHRWQLGGDIEDDQKWHNKEGATGTSECNAHSMETISNEGDSRLVASDDRENSVRTRENSMNEGLWELELDQTEESESGVVADMTHALSSSSEQVPVKLSDISSDLCSNDIRSSSNMVSKDNEITKVESKSTEELRNDSGKDVSCMDKSESLSVFGSLSQDTQMPSDSSFSNFSSYASAQESCLTPLSIRRGSFKRQTKIEIEEEISEVNKEVEESGEIQDASSTKNIDAVTPNGHMDLVSPIDRMDTVTPTGSLGAASPPILMDSQNPDQMEAASLISHLDAASQSTESSQEVNKVLSPGRESTVKNQPPAAMQVEEVPTAVKKEMELCCAKEEENMRKRALSPHGRSGSAHSDSSGFLEWDPPNLRIPQTPQSPPLCVQHPSSLRIGKEREWSGAENNQLPSPDCGTTVGSSGYYGVEGLSSELTGQPDRVELALRAYRRDSAESGRGESGDGTGRELALGRGSWQGREVVAECSSEEGTEEEMLQLAHRELCFVREMRCCVSEGMDRVMQFLGTWSKRRHFHPCQGTPRDTDRDAAQISSIMSQMTFLLKQQSQLCHEMEQLSMQRLLDGPPLSSSRDRLPEVKGSSSVLGIKGGEKEGGMVIRRRSQEDAPRPSTSQPSAETAAESKERCLEGMVEQNARELAELKSLLRAVLTPNQGNREQ